MSHLLPGCSDQLVRTARRPEGIIVPAYFYPESENLNYWAQLDSAAALLGRQLVVVANPANGPGEAVDSNYVRVLTRLRHAGARIIGYVHTCWGDVSDQAPEGNCWRPLSVVHHDIERWYDWYEIDGLFFDEASGRDSKVGYYRGLFDFVRHRQPAALVVNNFGAVPNQAFLEIGDSVMCVFENHSGFRGWRHQQSWLGKNHASRFLALAYAVSATQDLQGLLEHAGTQNIGWIYLTEQSGGNPWGKLPAFWQQMVNLIAR